MQLIKPIGAFLIHSAYINSRGCGYHRMRNCNSNNVRSSLFAENNSSVYGTDVVESELPSLLSSKFESPLYSREDKLRRMMSGDRRGVFPETMESHPKTSYVDEFNSDDRSRRGFRPDVGYMRDRDQRYGVPSYKESRLDRRKGDNMRAIREYGLKSQLSEEIMMGEHEGYRDEFGDNMNKIKYTNDINDVFDREYFEPFTRRDKKFNRIEYRKKKKKEYETIEVRLSLRIQEADLLNKCKFFKKKALKGYPLNFKIRVDGNPDEFMLAAEGILNKARMFLSDACTAPTNLTKSNTSISLCFSPLNKPAMSNRSMSPYERSGSQRVNYMQNMRTYNVSETSNMGKVDMDPMFDTPSSPSIVSGMPGISNMVNDGHNTPNVANRPSISNITSPDVSMMGNVAITTPVPNVSNITNATVPTISSMSSIPNLTNGKVPSVSSVSNITNSTPVPSVPNISSIVSETPSSVFTTPSIAIDNIVPSVTSTFDTPSRESPNISMVGVPPTVTTHDMNPMHAVANLQKEVNPSTSRPISIVQDTKEVDSISNLVELQQEQERPSRFMTLNKRKESRWIVKHSKSDESESMGDSSYYPSSSYGGSTGPSLLTGSMANLSTIGTPGTIGYIRTAHNYSAHTFGNHKPFSMGPSLNKGMNTGPDSDVHTSSKWKVLNKKNEVN